MANFYNPYMLQGNYMTELQNMRDRIDGQIQQMQQQQQSMSQVPMQQPTNLTQNFQLAPNVANSNFKLVNGIEDVKKEIVIMDTYFLAKDNTQMWVKSPRGEIRIFDIKEVVPKDDKDLLIEQLQKQIEELKGGSLNEPNESNGKLLCEQPNTGDDEQFGEQITTNGPESLPALSNGKATKRKP